jgi:hypothetical protein
MPAKAQTTQCLTPVTPDVLADLDLESFSARLGGAFYTVQIFVHVVNENDGTGGPAWADVYTELGELENDFAPHSICFALAGTDEINNSYYTTNFNSTKGEQLALVNPHSQAIDIYILPDYTGHPGSSYSIPNIYLTMGAQKFGDHTMSHEMGHCLGLYHCHETVFGSELVDGSNCSTAGDKICDTPAEPNLSGLVDASCTYQGAGLVDANLDPYTPNTHNIMSYTVHSCRDHFTSGQQTRMYANLFVGGVLSDVIMADNSLSLTGYSIIGGNLIEGAINTINAGIGTSYDVGGNAQVSFISGEHIRLTEGFTASPASGGVFTAMMHKCSASTSAPNTNFMSSSGEVNTAKQVTALIENENQENGLRIYPNPFIESTTIELPVSESSKTVTIDIFNIAGQVVRTLVNKQKLTTGDHHFTFKKENLPAGVFMAVIQIDDVVETRKLVLLK